MEINRRCMSGIAETTSEEKATIATNLLAFLRKHPDDSTDDFQFASILWQDRALARGTPRRFNRCLDLTIEERMLYLELACKAWSHQCLQSHFLEQSEDQA